MKALLHCGTFKTGSTAIQNTAWLNQAALRENDILYPRTGIDERAAKDDGEIGYRHSRFVYECGNKNFYKLLASLDEEIKADNSRTLFMSAEPWSAPKSAAALKKTIDHLSRQGFNEIRGLVFVRSARDYMVRHYREWVRRHGASKPFASYALSRKHFFDYLTICRDIKTVFNGRVDFVDYNAVSNVCEYTFDQLGIAYDTLSLPTRSNPGISCLDAEVHRILNEYGLRLSSTPDGKALLGSFGLLADLDVLSEKLPDNFKDIYGSEYIRKFSDITGIKNESCKAIFNMSQKNCTDIATTSPIIEKILMEWLKTKRRENT